MVGLSSHKVPDVGFHIGVIRIPGIWVWVSKSGLCSGCLTSGGPTLLSSSSTLYRAHCLTTTFLFPASDLGYAYHVSLILLYTYPPSLFRFVSHFVLPVPWTTICTREWQMGQCGRSGQSTAEWSELEHVVHWRACRNWVSSWVGKVLWSDRIEKEVL